MVIVLVGTLAAGAVLLALGTRQRATNDASVDLELLSALVSGSLNASLATNPDEPAARALARLVPGRSLLHQRQILVSDAKGLIVTALPSDDPPAGSLTEWLGASWSHRVGSPDGAAQVRLANGRDALAVASPLQEPLGQLVVVQPIDGVLETWAASAWRWGAYLAAAIVALLSLAGTYMWQRLRAVAADRECQQAREVIDAALDSGGCGLWNWDVEVGRLYWSSSMFTMLGMPAQRHAIRLADVQALLHPDDVPLHALAEAALTSASEKIDHTFRIRNAAGEWQWLRARATICRDGSGRTRIIGIAVDITAEKRRAQETETADERLRDAIESISEAFVVWDAENRLVVWNTKFQHFHNLPASTMVVGMPYRDVVTIGAAPAVQNHIALAGRNRTEDRTYKAKLADGRWLQISERRTKDGGYVSVGTDITNFEAHETKLKESERRLRDTVDDLRRNRQTLEMQTQQLADMAERFFDQKAEAEKANEAKSKFLGNMSHQLWTPLNAIIGFSEVMEKEMFGRLGSPKYIDYSADIRRSGEYLRDVIGDVLEMTRLDAGRVQLEKRLIEIGAVARAAIGLVEPAAAAKSISLAQDLECAPSLHGDPGAIAKIISVLLDNAIKFTPAGGQVDVRAYSAGASLNLFVADSGVGIAKEALNRLGRPFEPLDDTLDDGLKGSGLGLAIASSLARLHGGSLRIRSRIGIGTIVLLHLPLHARVPRTAALPLPWETALAG